MAAATLHDAAGVELAGGDAAEGPQWFATVGPGLVQIGRVDLARKYRREEKALRTRRAKVCEHIGWRASLEERNAEHALWAAGMLPEWPASDSGDLDPGVDPLGRYRSRTRITEWSGKSRSNMIRRLSTLDYGPLLEAGVPAMVTATLPDEWETIAPTGKAFKLLVRKFLKRYERAWRRRLVGVWKLEFQRRGAPHLHVLMVPPTGEVDGLRWREWFARTWAECLGVQGETFDRVVSVHAHRKASQDYAEGLRASDPKRVAVYFLKHGLLSDKEYQHIVPTLWQGEGDGPGRFWGYWGLQRADQAVPLTVDQAVTLARTLRRWERSKGAIRKAVVWRVDRETGQCRKRVARRRVRRMPGTAGFTVVNDGPGVALMLAKALTA